MRREQLGTAGAASGESEVAASGQRVGGEWPNRALFCERRKDPEREVTQREEERGGGGEGEKE